jgi:hypothetical protein
MIQSKTNNFLFYKTNKEISGISRVGTARKPSHRSAAHMQQRSKEWQAKQPHEKKSSEN